MLPSLNAATFCLPRSGYVQAIDYTAIAEHACRCGAIVALAFRPGHYILDGVPYAQVAPAAALTDALKRKLMEAVAIGPERTAHQDLEYSVRQLVEIALRALSPGINDPRTAIGCIDRLTQALAEMLELPEPPTLVPDDDGELRLIVKPARFADVLGAAFDPIREAGARQAWILRRLAEVLALLAGFAHSADQRSALDHQAAALANLCRQAPLDAANRARVEHSLVGLRRALAAPAT
jgi:uncharacterized membrane protein